MRSGPRKLSATDPAPVSRGIGWSWLIVWLLVIMIDHDNTILWYYRKPSGIRYYYMILFSIAIENNSMVDTGSLHPLKSWIRDRSQLLWGFAIPSLKRSSCNDRCHPHWQSPLGYLSIAITPKSPFVCWLNHPTYPTLAVKSLVTSLKKKTQIGMELCPTNLLFPSPSSSAKISPRNCAQETHEIRGQDAAWAFFRQLASGNFQKPW